MLLNLIPLILGLGMGEIIVIVIVVLLFFGGKRIPELMRGLGKGVSSFRQGLNDVTDDINRAGTKPASHNDRTTGTATRSDADSDKTVD